MVADFWSGLDPTDPTGSAGPGMVTYIIIEYTLKVQSNLLPEKGSRMTCIMSHKMTIHMVLTKHPHTSLTTHHDHWHMVR